jgi:small subunit ribosomal protein S14
MAKVCMIERDKKRKKMVKSYANKRAKLKATIKDQSVPAEERFQAVLKLAKLPRNSSKVRMRNRCALTGRPRGYYRKLNLSRIALRDLASRGELPGVVKSSW